MKVGLLPLALLMSMAGTVLAKTTSGQELLKQKISLVANKEEVKNVLREISRKADVKFIYLSTNGLFKEKVTFNAQNEELGLVLNALFNPIGIKYEVMGGQIILKKNTGSAIGLPESSMTKADSGKNIMWWKTITGKVLDEKGMPVGGVSVIIKGTSQGTVTNSEGIFSINANEGEILEFTIVGYSSYTVKVGAKTNFTIQLKQDVTSLNDVVVTGYGKSSKRNIIGAITTVTPEEFNVGVVNSPAQLLQGKVAGLNITRSGDPNASASVILRGPSTLREGGAQEPFYVIDGVPDASIDLIAPDDIVSIDVLKDASSTSIYGARAANGVIMITTRRAKTGQSHLSYNGYVASEKVSKRIDMLSGDELRKYLADNGQSLSPANNDSLANTNWQDKVQRGGISHNHNLYFGGNSGHTTFGAGVNYLNNQGIMKGSSLQKSIIKANIDHRVFNDRLKLSLNVVYSNTTQDKIPVEVFQNMLTYLPTKNIHQPDGSYTEDFSRGSYLNPVSLIDNNIDNLNTKTFLANGGVEVKILPGLQYTLSLTTQSQQANENIYRKAASGLAQGLNGQATRTAYQSTKKVAESYFNYEKSFGLHNLKLLGGYSWQEDRYGDGFGVTTQGFVSDELTYNNLYFSNPPTLGNIGFANNSIKTLRLISFYGRINYQFADKYLFQVSLRNDGSSAFGSNHTWGYFPAVSAGWHISREKFMNKLTFLDDLKLRVGYGVSGNSLGFDPLIAQLQYGTAGHYYSNGQLVNAIAPVQNENPDLKWESTAMTNIGLDFSLAKGRFSGSVDYYFKNTSDLIWTYPVSATQYFASTLTANAGKVNNKGIELVLNAIPVKTRDFTWKTSFNLAHNTNKLVSLSNSKFTLPYVRTAGIGGKGQSGNWEQIVQQGMPIGSFNMWHYAGKNQQGVTTIQSGDSATLTPTTSDYLFPGNAQPQLLLGWSNTFTYKRFDFNVFLRAVTGNKILNATLAGLNSPADAKNLNIPRFTLGESYKDYNAYLISDRFLENGTYLRLDNATLGYSFRMSPEVMSKLRIYASVNNLFVITKYRGIDPEINLGGLTPGIDNNNFYPKTRSFILGVNVIF